MTRLPTSLFHIAPVTADAAAHEFEIGVIGHAVRVLRRPPAVAGATEEIVRRGLAHSHRVGRAGIGFPAGIEDGRASNGHIERVRTLQGVHRLLLAAGQRLDGAGFFVQCLYPFLLVHNNLSLRA